MINSSKEIDMEEPTSLLNTESWGTQRRAEVDTMLFQRKQTHSEVTNEKRKERTPKHVSKRDREHAGKTTSASRPAETPCMDHHRLSLEDFNSARELAPTCAQIGTNLPELEDLPCCGHAGTISHQVEPKLVTKGRHD